MKKNISGKNYFNQESLEKMCEALESGYEIEVWIDCIGHTRNNMEQEHYKEALMEKYGDKVEVKIHEGYCIYEYSYKLI